MKRLIFAAIVSIAFALGVAGQPTETAEKGLFWSTGDPRVDVLIINRTTGFNLIVISERDVKVIYRTKINSMESVEAELAPVKTAGAVRYFLVKHSFSRRTIWMALDFAVDGKPVPSLTRTFYNGLLELVPNERFIGNLRDTQPDGSGRVNEDLITR
jgi:hypothetical protein